MAVGEHVAADVGEHDQVGLEPVGRLREAGGDLRRAAEDVEQHRLLAEEVRHVRLGEQHVAPAHARTGAREEHARGELVGVLDLGGGARPGHRVDRPPLPRDPAHHRTGAVVEPRGLCGGQRAHHVAAAADPDHERAAGAGEHEVGVFHLG